MALDRRTLVKGMAFAGGGLGLTVWWAGSQSSGDVEVPSHNVTAWLNITPENRVTIYTSQSEMGQGVLSSLPAIVAEELNLSWDQVDVAMPPSDPVYNIKRGRRVTSRSESISFGFEPMRQAGAAARQMLLTAAAGRWNVPVDECHTQDGVVYHTASGRSATFGALAEAAAQLPLPETVETKQPKDWRLIGKSLPRKDVEDKCRGRATFGIDVKLDGLLTATIQACPVFGGKLVSVDPAPALALPGVTHVVPLDDAVAVVAKGYWQALKGLQALTPVWDFGEIEDVDNDAIDRSISQALDQPGQRGRAKGDAAQILASAPAVVEAEYSVPYLAHACMEPMNATVHVEADRVRAWVPTQAQSDSVLDIAAALNVPPESITLHTTYMGGGFGRRSYRDFCIQAALISRQAKAPVKLVWSREEDIAQDFFRPTMAVRYRGAIDAVTGTGALEATIAGPSMGKSFNMPPNMEAPINVTSLSGDAYDFSDLLLGYSETAPPVRYGIWRATVASHNCFFIESFVDELAVANNMSPLDLRRRLAAKDNRAIAALDAIEAMSREKESDAENQSVGYSFVKGWGSYTAIAVSLRQLGPDRFSIADIACVADCGIVVNPSIVEAQLTGGIYFGLSSTLFEKVEIADGRATSLNFDRYRLLRFDEAPPVRARVLSSEAAPGGVGELTTAAIVPAVTNAIAAANGPRVRRLPISDSAVHIEL